jgi:hypothetical protein
MSPKSEGKRPVVIHKHVTNNDNSVTNNDNRVITNNNDNSVTNNTTNNDNRVTNNNNITYNVRTKDNKPAAHWIDAKTGLPKTNVASVSWHKRNGKWRVQAIDAETKRQKHVGLREDWHDAVRLREEAQKTEGTMGPGELEFTEDGEAVAACGLCRRTFGIASYAPEPCKYKKEFAQFAKVCVEIGSDDPKVAAEAEKTLAVMPKGRVNKALRTSKCRGCREVKRKSTTVGPNSVPARCRDVWIEICKDKAKRGCRDCGEDRPECFESEHADREGKPEGCRSIMDWEWFANKYKERGPEEMWKAYRDEHVVPLCRCCHLIQSTHNGARGADSSTLADGSDAKRQREYKEAKTAHNNKRKREFVNVKEDGRELPPGQCYYCEDEFVVAEGEERAMEWMHQCEESKKCTISKLVGDRKSPETAIPLIDAEIDGTNGSGGCRLGCANCHYSCETLPRSKEGTPLWDALMAKPVRKRVS